MKTTNNNNEMMTKAINHAEKMVSVCNKQIEYLTHPETYGCCLSKCNSIVINKERMMTVTTDETHHTTYEFSPLYPTYFSPETAREIVENDIYKDINLEIRKDLTAVEDIELDKAVANVAYFNLAGQKCAEPVNGVNIVVTTYTDGTTTTAKVVK